MSGHSKWANIKHRKERQDSVKSKKFQKLVNDIQKIALLNSNPETNSELNKIIQNARKENLPKDLINRALKKVENLDNLNVYFCEGRFAKKINFLIKVVTDNFIRTLHNIKETIKKTKIEILPSNSIKHLFQLTYKLVINKVSEELLLDCLNEVDVFKINETKKEIIEFFFNNSSEIKKFKNILLKKDIKILESFEIFESFKKIELSLELLEKYKKIKLNLYNLSEVKVIFDDLKENES